MVPTHDFTEVRHRWKRAVSPPYNHSQIDHELHPDSRASDNGFTTSGKDVPEHI